MKMSVGRNYLVVFVVLVMGCVSIPRYWPATNLNNLSIGLSKDVFINYWGNGKQCSGWLMQACQVPILRAAQVGSDGVLTEVMTMPLSSPENYNLGVDYWFLFRKGQLVQWGRPEDWQSVSARYEVNFNPSPSVRR